MENFMMANRSLFRMFLSRVLPLAALALAALSAIAQTDPPARVGSLTQVEGSVVFAPAGETEWTAAALNRPITRGDRLWTDRGARAELHLGSAVLHIDSEAFLDLVALDEAVFQASLNEGSVNMRVRELEAGENLEIDTPHLAFRAAQPGDYRIDVDPAGGTTRVTVRSGMALVYGTSGQALQLQAGQQLSFAGRDLDPVSPATLPLDNGFDRWAADRNRLEDQSISARYLPRDVVGYAQLDMNGTWAQDPGYGAVWYPRVAAADWAPYRYGRWESISPWGWTWIDDAPWGFAPFHYGRWALIGSRWAWVPGRLGPRPVYSPALVVFIGGGSAGNFSVGSSPGIGWYPLAPGEAWRPGYRASPAYLRNVNRFIAGSSIGNGMHVHPHRPEALTAVRIDDFSQGRPVQGHWSRPSPADLAHAQVIALPAVTGPRRWSGAGRAATMRMQPPTRLSAPVMADRPAPRFQGPATERLDARERNQPIAGARNDAWRQRQEQIHQERVQREQQARRERTLHDQQMQQLRVQREQQVQHRRQQHEQQQRAGPQQQPEVAPQPRAVPAQGQTPQAERGPGRGRPDGGAAAGTQGREERPSGEEEGGRGHGRRQIGRFN
jgi:hypothetical protein